MTLCSKSVKKDIQLAKKNIEYLFEKDNLELEKELDKLEMPSLLGLSEFVGMRGDIFEDIMQHFLGENKTKYPLAYNALKDGVTKLIRREDIAEFMKELVCIKEYIEPIVRKDMIDLYVRTGQEISLTEELKKTNEIMSVTDTSYDSVSFGDSYECIFNILKVAEFAKKHNLDIVLHFSNMGIRGPYAYTLDIQAVKKAIQDKDMDFFEEKFKKSYEKQYQIIIESAKTTLMRDGLDQAIANAIVGEAKSRNYKSTGFIDEEQFICMAIEWYSKDIGIDWNKLADKCLGESDVKIFNPKNTEKILKILGQMKEKPKETANYINKLIEENFGGEFKVDEKWMTQILNQVIDVVKEAINKNLELVICQTYE